MYPELGTNSWWSRSEPAALSAVGTAMVIISDILLPFAHRSLDSIRPIYSNPRLGQPPARRWRGDMGSNGKILWDRPDSIFECLAGPTRVEVYLHKPRSRGPPCRACQDTGDAKAGTSLRSATIYSSQHLTGTSARPSTLRTSVPGLDLTDTPVPARILQLGRPWFIGFDGHPKRGNTHSE